MHVKFFRSVWLTKPDKKLDSDVLCRRAQLFVFRFFIEREIFESNYFGCYPLCFPGWANIKREPDGEMTYPDYSMFPADGLNAKRALHDWEVFNCPWYIDTISGQSLLTTMKKLHFQRSR